MFGGSAPAQRFLEMIGNVRTNKNTFAISHLNSPLLALGGENYPAISEQVYKPNSVLRLLEVAIIHLVQPLPAGSSDLPGGRSVRLSLT